MARLAFLGGGRMAQAMAARHLAAGQVLIIYNRTPEKLAALADRGAIIAKTPRAAADGADIVFASVIDDRASEAVWTGPDGAMAAALAPGAILVEHSTLSHNWLLALSRQSEELGLRFVDAPVAGRPDAATAGQLSVFAGARDADLDAIRPHLATVAKAVFHLGQPGAGTAFKLIYNLMGVAQIVALAEALAAAQAAGIDLQAAALAVSQGGTGSPHVIRHAAAMALNTHEDPPGFTVDGRLKDSLYGVQFEESLGQKPLVGRAALAAYQHMADLGRGPQADSRIIDLYRADGAADV